MVEFELVLPCYNESKSLQVLIERAIVAAQKMNFDASRFNLVLVENGSLDDSAKELARLKASPLGQWFRVVPVAQNQGYGFGLWSGLRATQAHFVAWSHADQQCDPADAFRALETLKTMANPKKGLVKGVRSGRNWKDKCVSRVFEMFAWVILGKRIYEINAQPKVFHRELLTQIVNPPYTFAFDLYVLYRAKKYGYQMTSIDVVFPPRVHGVSNWASHFAGRWKTILGIIQYMWELRRMEGRI